jgi:GSH-dependent disulfide-bond oxidoreductase
MITVYVHGGPNPRKVTILLEELGWPYKTELVDIYEGRHLEPEFLKVSPNGRLPALMDSDGDVLVWESGVILQYLAEKSGRFLPGSGAKRYDVLKWMHFQLTHAPYLGNAHLYRLMYREPMPFDIKRFTIEATRIYRVLNQQLAAFPFIAGDEYSIADIAWYPWIEYHAWQGQDLSDYPSIESWLEKLKRRPAVVKGASIPWSYGEYGPSDVGNKVKVLIEQRLNDPAFALRATEADAAIANLAF